MFLIVVILVTLCGCSSKNTYDDYEHYDLSNNINVVYHSFSDSNNIIRTYAIADITPEKYECLLYGIFYKVGNNDYILLEKFEPYNNVSINGIAVFVDDKAYVSGISYGKIVEYSLDGIDFVKKPLEFSYGNIIFASRILDLKDGYIYIRAAIDIEASIHHEYNNFKCSLSTYQCEVDENKK